ncbi:FkbM family methyltransferase [Aminipila terrae]|uniref:FkbM family methyltransferase n=1 Tax=Aminipila terrae TaxID=2697030 RepID=A0A6P1MH80_9FIRM|nr:FkbM family methyltransferase [Aminipila terrae]QHI71944.1 FkbM family methyltransferase [Aminipila terrae]
MDLLWRGGFFAEFIKEYCYTKKRLPFPAYVCDNNKSLWGEKVAGVVVEPPEKMAAETVEDCVIVISSALPYSIMSDLMLKYQKHYYCIITLVQLQTYFFIKNNKEKLRDISELFEDTKSKDHYVRYFKLLLESSFNFLPVYTQNAYWDNDLIGHLKDGEVVVYAGAYDGKHIDRALKSNSNAIIHGFEPNAPFAERLQKRYKDKENVFIHNYALYDERTVLSFDSSVELSAKVINDKNINGVMANQDLTSIKTVKLDDEVFGKVDLIALDVEGSEMKALWGSRKIIEKDRPKLAICVYHSLQDYIDIPKKILELNPNYKLYFRHHSPASIESVVYAIDGGKYE